MKKLIAILLVCMLLTACGTTPTRVRDLDDDDEKEGIRLSFAETAVAETAPNVTVTFKRYIEGASEYAAIRGVDQNGSQLWVVTTALLPVAQMDRVSDIGLYGDRYYYIEDGAVVAVRVSDGAILWKNEDFGGSPAENCTVIGEDGTVYLSGFFGPDLFVVDAQGNTLKKVSQVSADYYWPCRLEIDTGRGVATVYMSGGPQGDVGSANAVPLEIELP